MDLKKIFGGIFSLFIWLTVSVLPVFAAQTDVIPRWTAMDTARQTLIMHSVDGEAYTVFLIGSGERMGSGTGWAQPGEPVYSGKYHVYISPMGSSRAFQQPVRIFRTLFKNTGTEEGIIRPYEPHRSGVYVVAGKIGAPDILVSVQQDTGSGFYTINLFAIKDGLLQHVDFLNPDHRVFRNYVVGCKPVRYLEDGTLAVYWWQRKMPQFHISVYMVDKTNLLASFAYSMEDAEGY